jgi:hypothetical protein
MALLPFLAEVFGPENFIEQPEVIFRLLSDIDL